MLIKSRDLAKSKCVKIGAVWALVIPVLIFSTSPVILAQEGSISIVPGASSPNNVNFYQPSQKNIPINSTLIWVNNDSSLHTVTATNSTNTDSQVFDSGIINPGQIWQHKFKQLGLMEYYCTLHPFMKGIVNVTR